MLKRVIPTGYSALPDEASKSLRELADKFFEPSTSVFLKEDKTPKGYTKVTTLFNKNEKAETKEHYIKTEENFKKFSAY